MDFFNKFFEGVGDIVEILGKLLVNIRSIPEVLLPLIFLNIRLIGYSNLTMRIVIVQVLIIIFYLILFKGHVAVKAIREFRISNRRLIRIGISVSLLFFVTAFSTKPFGETAIYRYFHQEQIERDKRIDEALQKKEDEELWNETLERHKRRLSPTYLQSMRHNYNPDSCLRNCSGHEAGYQRAMQNDIAAYEHCGGNSQSFIEGCKAYVFEMDEIRNEAVRSYSDKKRGFPLGEDYR